MNNKNHFLTPLIVLALSLPCFAQEAGVLTITATNFEGQDGTAVVNLFREQDDLPKKPFMTVKAIIASGVSELIIEGLPTGSYAAIVYHDENNNGTLDHKFGFPAEPMGFSNDWNLSLFSGMPSFKKLRFEHSGPHTAINIKVD
jgi:uncharacterized protein (DUF2141 family)